MDQIDYNFESVQPTELPTILQVAWPFFILIIAFILFDASLTQRNKLNVFLLRLLSVCAVVIGVWGLYHCFFAGIMAK